MKPKTATSCIAGVAAVGGLLIAWSRKQQQQRKATATLPSSSTPAAPSTPSTASPPSPASPLLALPPEVRNMIWEETIKSETASCVDRVGCIYPCRAYNLEPPFLRTCKQIRSEGRSIFYADTKFTLTFADQTDHRALQKLHLWLQHIGKEACGSVRTIEITVEDTWLPEPYQPKGGEFLALITWDVQTGSLPTSSIRVKTKSSRADSLEQDLGQWATRMLEAGQLARRKGMMRCTALHLAKIAEERVVTEGDARGAWAQVISGKMRSAGRRLGWSLLRGLYRTFHFLVFKVIPAILFAVLYAACMVVYAVFYVVTGIIGAANASAEKNGQRSRTDSQHSTWDSQYNTASSQRSTPAQRPPTYHIDSASWNALTEEEKEMTGLWVAKDARRRLLCGDAVEESKQFL